MIEKNEKKRDIIGKNCDLMRGISNLQTEKLQNLESIRNLGDSSRIEQAEVVVLINQSDAISSTTCGSEPRKVAI